MNTICYSRVSTSDQADNGVSLDVQRAKITAYCALYGLTIIEFIEDDESGKNLKRPGIQKALEMLRSGQAESICIMKLDRLSRSVRDWAYLVETYFGEKGGKSLFSVNDSIDTRTAAGRLVLNILVSVAEWERTVIGERTRDALQHKKGKGERVGTIPFGFDLAADGVMLVENAAEQRILKIIRGMHADGWSYRRIAAELDRRNLPTKRGGAWTPGVVRKCVMKGAAV